MKGRKVTLSIITILLILGVFWVLRPVVDKKVDFQIRSEKGYKLKMIKTALDIYYREHGDFPNNLQVLLDQGIIKKEEELIDSWGNVYNYSVSNEGYTLFSSGPDGLKDTQDDIFL